ncbi:hypothetical protein DFH06DRAFT_1139426 [Mycena polygramma]|nr:hypothetical protein DFH06DRAFT_1139426 [Mycena polygramma]
MCADSSSRRPGSTCAILSSSESTTSSSSVETPSAKRRRIRMIELMDLTPEWEYMAEVSLLRVDGVFLSVAAKSINYYCVINCCATRLLPTAPTQGRLSVCSLIWDYRLASSVAEMTGGRSKLFFLALNPGADLFIVSFLFRPAHFLGDHRVAHGPRRSLCDALGQSALVSGRHFSPSTHIRSILYATACVVAGSYCVTRRVIGHSTLSRAIVESAAHYWTRLNIDCNSRPSEIANHLAFLGNTHLDVTMSFDPEVSLNLGPSPQYAMPVYELYAFHGSYTKHTPLPDAYDSDLAAGKGYACMLAAAVVVDRWRNVTFSSSIEMFLAAVVCTLKDRPGPDIQSLSVSCPEIDGPMSCRALLSIHPHFFRAFLPRVRNLALNGVGIPWNVQPHFQSLVTLDIQNLTRSLWPSLDVFVTALTASPSLKELTLGRGGVFISPLVEVPPFKMPSLQKLTVLSGDPSSDTVPLIRVLAAGIYPVLRECRFHDFSTSEWLAALAMGDLTRLEELWISGSACFPSYLGSAIFATMSNVVYLDLGDAEGGYMRALSSVPHCICPRLRNLTVGRVDVQLLIDFTYVPDVSIFPAI